MEPPSEGQPAVVQAMPPRPHVLVNMAMSADGKTDSFERRGARISSPADIERVDRLRAASDAVMVGGRTLLAEDPRLTVRSPGLVAGRRARGEPDQPAKAAVAAEIPDAGWLARAPTSRFLHEGGGRVAVFTTARTTAIVRDRLRHEGAEVVEVGDETVDLPAALAWLGRAGVRRLMVEGGGTLVAALLAGGLVDELQLFVAPLLLGGAGAPSPVDGPGFPAAAALHIRLASVERIEQGIVLRYVIPRPAPGPASDRSVGGTRPVQEPAP